MVKNYFKFFLTLLKKNKIINFFLILVIFNFIFINFPNNYGDLAKDNIFIMKAHKTFVEKQGLPLNPLKKLVTFDEKSKFYDSFNEFLIDDLNIKFSDSHKKSFRDFTDIYYYDDINKRSKFYTESNKESFYASNTGGDLEYKCKFWFNCTTLETIKALSHSVMIGLSSYLFPYFSAEISVQIFIIICFVLNFIFHYKFGSLLINKKFGLILSVIASSNVYFNILNRSFAIIPMAINPLLTAISFFFLIKLFKKENDYFTLIILLSFSIALNIFNGYPNTSVILNLLVISYFIFFYFLKVIRIQFIKNKINLASFPILIFLSFAFIFLLSCFYSIFIRGENIFYFFSILDTRIRHFYDYWYWKTNVAQIQTDYIGNLINNIYYIFNKTNFYFPVHETTKYSSLNFINIFEKLFLLIGIFFIFFKIKLRSYKFYFFLPLFLYFITLMTFFGSYGPDRVNFYLFYNVTFFISLGIYCTYLILKKIKIFRYSDIISLSKYYFLKLLISLRSNYQLINNSNFRKSSKNNLEISLYILLISIVITNSYELNKKYIKDYNANLGEFDGMSQLNKYLNKNTKENDKTFFFLKSGSGESLHRTTGFDGKYKFELIDDFEKIFKSSGSLNSYLIKNDIYIVVPGEIKKKSKSFNNNIFYFELLTKFEDYFNIYDYEVSIIGIDKNYPSFYVYKLNKPYYRPLNIKNINNIILKNPTKPVEFICKNGQKFKFNYEGLKPNFINIELDSGKIDVHAKIFYNENIDNEFKSLLNPVIKDISEIDQNNLLTNKSSFLYNLKTKAKYSKLFKSNLKFNNIKLVNSYLLYNDKKGKNYIKIYIKEQRGSKKRIDLIKSNKSGNYAIFKTLNGEGDVLTSDIGIINNYKKINNSEFELIYEVFSTKNKSGLISYDSPFSLGANSTISLELKDDELYLFKKNCDEIVKSNNKIEFF